MRAGIGLPTKIRKGQAGNCKADSAEGCVVSVGRECSFHLASPAQPLYPQVFPKCAVQEASSLGFQSQPPDYYTHKLTKRFSGSGCPYLPLWVGAGNSSLMQVAGGCAAGLHGSSGRYPAIQRTSPTHQWPLPSVLADVLWQ